MQAISNNNKIKITSKNTVNSEYFRSINQETGGYKRLELLGQGSFGRVFKVQCSDSNIIFALKLLAFEVYQSNSKAAKYVETESEILRKIKNSPHPHIVNVHDVLDDFSYVFEFCNGGSFKDYIQQNSSEKVSEHVLRAIFLQLLSALQYLHSHEKPIIHRDLKPANILVHKIGNRFVFKISDFGFAKSNEVSREFLSSVGSPFFQAPEVGVKKYTFSADIYSLGIILYYYARASVNSGSAEKPDPNKPKNYLDSISSFSDELKHLLTKMMCKDPNERITIKDIISHKWVQDKAISLLLPGKERDRTFISLADLEHIIKFVNKRDDLDVHKISEIESRLNLSILDHFILVSYYDSDRLVKIDKLESPLRPIYTIDKVYLFDKNNSNQLLMLPIISQISKYYSPSKSVPVWTVQRYQDVNALSNQFNEIYEKLMDAKKVQQFASIRMKKLLDHMMIYQILGEFYINEIKKPEFQELVNRFKHNKESYTNKLNDMLAKINSLKDIDRFGNDTDTPLVNRLPFIKTINNQFDEQYKNIIETAQDVNSNQHTFDPLKQSIYEALKEIDILSKDYDKSVNAIKNNHRLMEESKANYASFGFIFDTGPLMNECSVYIDSCYKLYDNLFKSLNSNIAKFIWSFTQLVRSTTVLEGLYSVNHDQKHQDTLLNEISGIPTYLSSYKLELKRRNKYLQEYTRQCKQKAHEIHTLTHREMLERRAFIGIPQPKYFIPVDLPNEGLDNLLANYLDSNIAMDPYSNNILDYIRKVDEVEDSLIFDSIAHDFMSDASEISMKSLHNIRGYQLDGVAQEGNDRKEKEILELRNQKSHIQNEYESEIKRLKDLLHSVTLSTNDDDDEDGDSGQTTVIGNIKETVKEKDLEIAALKKQLQEYNSKESNEIAQLKKQVSDLNHSLKNNNTKDSNEVTQLKKQIDMLNESTNSAMKVYIHKLNEYEAQMGSFEKEKHVLLSDRNTLKQRNNALASRNSDLIEEKDKEQKRSTETISELTNQKEDAIRQMLELEKEKLLLEKENASLSKELKEIHAIAKMLEQSGMN